MANEQNLLPPNEVNTRRTPEKRKSDARKAGIASGVARKEKAKMKDILEKMLQEKPSDSELTYEQMVTLGLIKGAVLGNSKNYETICSMLGQKPAEKVEITQPPKIIDDI